MCSPAWLYTMFALVAVGAGENPASGPIPHEYDTGAGLADAVAR